MTTPPPNAPPGWYQDPANGTTRRYWDGTAWGPTEPPPASVPTVGAISVPAAPTESTPKSPNAFRSFFSTFKWNGRYIATAVVGVALLGALAVTHSLPQQQQPRPRTLKSGVEYSVGPELVGSWQTTGATASSVHCVWTKESDKFDVLEQHKLAMGEGSVVRLELGQNFFTKGCEDFYYTG